MGNHPTKHNSKDRPAKKNVHWKTAEPPAPPGKPILVGSNSEAETDVVTLKWQRPATDGGSPIIGYVIEHRRTGSPHWLRATPNLVNETQLSLSGLEPGWRYQFRVVAENVVGTSEPSELSDPLTVTLQKNAITPPRFTVELVDTVAVENDKVEFTVNFIGTPQAQISWFKDGFEIFSSRRTKILTENDTSVLTIHESALTDEGEIKCTATNRAGHVVTRAHLTVEAFPKIRLPRQYEDGLIIEAEEVIRLKVGIAGKPHPAVIWSHNGEVLTSGGRFDIASTDKHSSLKILHSQRSDRGEYNIRAINKLGEDNTSFLVTITARPQPPTKVGIKMSLGKTVTLSWGPPIDDGGCKIGNYIVEYYRIGWEVWLKASTCRQLTATLNDLIEGSEYKFRVKAENPYGLSDPSEESETLFIPDHKRGINKPADCIKNTEMIEKEKPVAVPRRKNTNSVSPPKIVRKEEEPSKKDSLENVQRIKKQNLSNTMIQLSPEVYDGNSLEREMSYGTTNNFYKFGDKSDTESEQPTAAERKYTDEMSRTWKTLSPDDANREDAAKKTSTNSLTKTSRNEESQPLHSSGEFMLVLYPDKESKSISNENTSAYHGRDFDEFVAPPPPLSLSAPEIRAEQLEPPTPLLRCAVSSTELLYERAMARFYQAVAFEESENARKRSISVADNEALMRRRRSTNTQELEGRKQSISLGDDDPKGRNSSLEQQNQQEPNLTRLRRNSLTESDKKSTLRRRLSGENPQNFSNLARRSSFREENEIEQIPLVKKKSNELALDYNENEIPLKRSPVPEAKPVEVAKEVEEQFSDDYTDSTASSASSLIDLKTMHNQILLHDADEMDTYHPRVMEPTKPQSPYRSPDPSQAVEVLSKPLPLPDPNFVPKPILKRPKAENVDITTKKAPDKPERKSLKQFFERDCKSSSPAPPQFEKELSPRNIPEQLPEIKIDQPISPNTQKKLSAAELQKKKKLEIRQNSLEENKVAIEYYGDIVRELGGTGKKPKTPIYLNAEEIKKAAEQQEKEESQHDLASIDSRYDDLYNFQPNQIQPASVVQKTNFVQQTNFAQTNFVQQPNYVQQSNSIQQANYQQQQNTVQQQSSPAQPSTSVPKAESLPKEPQSRSLSRQSLTHGSKDLLSSTIPDNRPITPEPNVNDHRRMRPSDTSRGAIPKKRDTSTASARSRTESKNRYHPDNKTSAEIPKDVAARRRNESKSPASRMRRPLRKEPIDSRSATPSSMQNRLRVENPIQPSRNLTPSPQIRTLTPEDELLHEEAQRNVKSVMSYSTDVALFILACWIYLFKDAKLAIPILILMIYRQLGDVVRDKIPSWMKRKKS